MQGIWFVPTFGQLSEEQIRAVPLAGDGTPTTTTYASYFITVAFRLTSGPPYLYFAREKPIRARSLRLG